jgi:hypothetical protein
MFGEVLEPLLAFLAASRTFAEVSRLAVVSKTWRRVSSNALKTAHQLNLSGFAESVTDAVVRLALVRVTSENLRLVNLSGCRNISAGGMEDILQYVAETCAGVMEVDVTACSNEAVLRAVATRARAALAPLALDLFALLRSMGEEGKRCSFSRFENEFGSLLHASPPLLLFDRRALAPRKKALLHAAAHGTAPEVAMLLSLSFRRNESDEGETRTYNVNARDSQDNAPLFLACRSGNFEIAEMLVVAGADVSAVNNRGDTPLLAAIGAGKLELAEMLVSKGANVEAVRMDGAGLISLAIVSQQTELLNLALTCSPKRLEHQDVMSASELAGAFWDPARIEAWLRTGASPIALAGQVGALIAFCALESSTKNRLEDVRAFLFHNLDMLQDPSKWPVTHAVQQLASQEAGTVFGEKYADGDKAAGESRFITWINKREKHLCRSIHRAQSAVRAVCYSPDGSKLARAEGSEVVVCDASTGFVLKRLSGHSDQ